MTPSLLGAGKQSSSVYTNCHRTFVLFRFPSGLPYFIHGGWSSGTGLYRWPITVCESVVWSQGVRRVQPAPPAAAAAAQTTNRHLHSPLPSATLTLSDNFRIWSRGSPAASSCVLLTTLLFHKVVKYNKCWSPETPESLLSTPCRWQVKPGAGCAAAAGPSLSLRLHPAGRHCGAKAPSCGSLPT